MPSISFTTALSRTKPITHLKHLVQHDKARAQKLLAGRCVIGPVGIQELRKKTRHHHHHGGDSTSTGSGVTTVIGGATTVTGGSTTVTGGATSVTGGITVTSGATTVTVTGGATTITVTGGATTGTGGTTTGTGGATTGTGGATTGTGGATTGDMTTAPATSGDTIDVTDAAVTYTTSVGVGTPATQFTLLIDTGSSNTWVGAGKKYIPTLSSKNTHHTVNVSYSSGQFSGTEYTDNVALGEDLVINNQSIGVASQAQGFNDVDGILGIGPVDLTQGTVEGEGTVPTVTDNLLSQGTISTKSIGIFYQPTTEANLPNGELTFGGADDSKVQGNITFVPITSNSPASNYWGIDQNIQYNGNTILSSSGIVDTGTTLILIATDAFEAYQRASGGEMDQSTGLLTFNKEQFNNLQNLDFVIGERTFSLTPNAQIWPRNLNSDLGGDANKIYGIVADLGNNSGTGLDFINGFAFLQHFYSVYDTTNSQVGIAETEFTNTETN